MTLWMHTISRKKSWGLPMKPPRSDSAWEKTTGGGGEEEEGAKSRNKLICCCVAMSIFPLPPLASSSPLGLLLLLPIFVTTTKQRIKQLTILLWVTTCPTLNSFAYNNLNNNNSNTILMSLSGGESREKSCHCLTHEPLLKPTRGMYPASNNSGANDPKSLSRCGNQSWRNNVKCLKLSFKDEISLTMKNYFLGGHQRRDRSIIWRITSSRVREDNEGGGNRTVTVICDDRRWRAII